jgi:hypothetical protein
MGHTLESHKFFSHVAWALVVCFALFTYTLTIQVQEELEHLSGGVDRLEQAVNETDTGKISQ